MRMILRNVARRAFGIAAMLALAAVVPASAPAQQAENAGAGAPSTAEARAIGYARTILTAEREYKKKHGSYAKALAALVGNGSFTRRITTPDRGDYTAHFASNGETFSVSMVPKTFDPQHRAWFLNETGTVRMEPDKPANAQSPPFRQ